MADICDFMHVAIEGVYACHKTDAWGAFSDVFAGRRSEEGRDGLTEGGREGGSEGGR